MSPSTTPLPVSEKRVSAELASEPMADNAAANAAPAGEPGTTDGDSSARGSRRARMEKAVSKARFVGGRLLYWAPVLIALTLFGQFAFLGLRKAVSESRRLDTAEIALEARHERAESLSRALVTELSARADPIYRERQRRFHLTKREDTPIEDAGMPGK